MHRLLTLKTPVLALILAVVAEVMLFLAALFLRPRSPYDQITPVGKLFAWIHALPEWLTMSFMASFKPFQDITSSPAQVTVTLMILGLALVQWYVVLLLGIGCYRRFCLKSAA